MKPTTSKKTYIGSTEKTFKSRFYNHKADMNNTNNRGKTTLAAHVWDLKDKGIVPNIKWEILKSCHKYACGGKNVMSALVKNFSFLDQKTRIYSIKDLNS